MSNAWWRPPRKDVWQDLQALALWMLIIGVAGYIIFPNFFKDLYSRLSDPINQAAALNTENQWGNSSGAYLNLNTYSNLNTDNSQNLLIQDTSSAVYNPNSGNNDISSGNWIIYVADGGFKQIAVSSEAHAFLQRLIQTAQDSQGPRVVILASNGQIVKYTVGAQIYTIVNNLSSIMARSNK